MRKTFVAALGAVLLTASCSGSDPKPVLDKFYGQQLGWGSCADYPGVEEADGLECARLTVPIDYENADGATAQVALSRVQARGERIGSLVIIPGGPGQAGIGLTSYYAGTDLGERFDVVSLDPRGTGASIPKVECASQTELEAMQLRAMADMTPAGVERAEADNKAYAQSCVDKTGVDFLTRVGTREAVRDLDVLRGALGEEKLTSVGTSYGSRVGSSYAERFPDKVRAMVLDAPVDPAAAILDPEAFSTGFQQAFDTYAADCARTAACPLGTDPARFTETLRSLVNPLLDEPAATKDPRGLNYLDALSAVLNSLYSPELWPGTNAGLAELREGAGDIMLERADLFRGVVDRAHQNAVLCLDEPRTKDRADAAAKYKLGIDAAPITDTGRFQGEAALDACAFWPVPPSSKPHELSVSGLPEVVVVATKGDPATPYAGGVKLARALDASLITYEGTQHGAFLVGVDCVDDPVLKYLTDLTSPPAAVTCPV